MEARDEWLDWRPQAMPPSSGAGLEGYENGHADLLQTGQLPPLPDLGGGDGGDWGDMRGLPLPDLPELPPLPDLPALPSLGGGVEGEGQGEAMEGVEAS